MSLPLCIVGVDWSSITHLHLLAVDINAVMIIYMLCCLLHIAIADTHPHWNFCPAKLQRHSYMVMSCCKVPTAGACSDGAVGPQHR
jgi:hypothetical protein